jgi:hypothetical protein
VWEKSAKRKCESKKRYSLVFKEEVLIFDSCTKWSPVGCLVCTEVRTFVRTIAIWSPGTDFWSPGTTDEKMGMMYLVHSKSSPFLK